jgi:hypothetical protein
MAKAKIKEEKNTQFGVWIDVFPGSEEKKHGTNEDGPYHKKCC